MKRAFTIIELLFSFAVLMVIIGGALAMLNIGHRGWSTEVGLLALHQQARQAMHGMVREIRQGQDGKMEILADGGRIKFEIPADVFDNEPTYYQPIDYYLSSEQLIREHPAGTTKVLANNIKSLHFCLWDGDDCCDPITEICLSLHAIEISLEVEKETAGEVLSFSIREEVRLRNE